MATVDESAFGFGAINDLLDRLGLDWLHVALLDVVVFALGLRLYELGARVAHWDEARVAYWTLRFMETGDFQYRPIIHGPFFHHVNKVLYETLGVSDFSMRLIVAVVGALLPLSALLLRNRLRDSEVIALALFLAINPILLYYSRFMRGDPMVGAFMFAAFAFFVRAVDTNLRRHFLAGTAMVALGFTVKENALLYLVCWAGALVLAVDHVLYRDERDLKAWARALYGGIWTWLGDFRTWLDRRDRQATRYDGDGDGEGRVYIWDDYERFTPRSVFAWALAFVVGAVEFLVIIVYFYAPRGVTNKGPGLGTALEDPSLLPAVVEAATIGAWMDFWGLWVSGDHQDHAYMPFFKDFAATMAEGAPVLVAFALIGFVADRYRSGGNRAVVAMGFYWGFASVLGYPLVTDIRAPWATIHAVLPLAIPAAVGIALVYRWGKAGLERNDRIATVAATFLLVVLALAVVSSGWGLVYADHSSSENELVQYAQPADDINPVMDRLGEAAQAHEGTDAIFYGTYFVDGGNASVPRKPGCAKWFNALPLPWYLSGKDVDSDCAGSSDELKQKVEQHQPPVIIIRESNRNRFNREFCQYHPVTQRLRAWGTKTTFLIHHKWDAGLVDHTDRNKCGIERP